MEQNLELEKIKGIVKRRKWWLILPFFMVAVSVTTVAVLLPEIYRSTATILIKNATIPDKLVAPTMSSYAQQRIRAIAQEVTARSKILTLVQKYDLLPKKRDKLTTEELVETIEKRINVQTIDAEIKKETIAFTLSYEDESPKKAQTVTNELASYFLEKNLEVREKHARTTAKFFEEQLQQAKNRVADLESKLASYREAHLEELPEFTSVNMQKLEKLNADIGNINMQIRSLEGQRATTRSQLAATDPYSFSQTSGSRVSSPDERLQQAQLERAALVAKYSAKHPLVLAKNQEIALLEGKSQDPGKLEQTRDRLRQLELELADLNSRYTEKHPAIKSKMQEIDQLKRELEIAQAKPREPKASGVEKATNPAYVGLKNDLEKTEVSITSLKAESTRIEEQIKVVYDKLHSMPQVSKQYNELSTDYQNAKINYNELQQKHLSAQLTQGMEEGQLGETFLVIEPAFLPEKPAKPNRLAIVLIGVVMGMGLSVGLASLREFTDNTLRDADTLEQLTGMPVFLMIPRIVTEQERIERIRKRVVLATGTVVGIAAAVLFFHFFVMDIYVFYARLERFLFKKFPI